MRKRCLSYYRLGLCPQDKGGSGRDVSKGVGWDVCFRRNSIEGWWKMSGLYSGVGKGGCGPEAGSGWGLLENRGWRD